jgi:hypothetical protein
MRAALRLAACLLALSLPAPASAQQASAEFPAGRSYIVQLTSTQATSGFGEYLVPPLTRAFRKAGLRYDGSPSADFAATVETGSDVGAWYGKGAARAWLYDRTVTVGLSPASDPIDIAGRLVPAFAVTVHLRTPNPDRVDELECLIALATAELAARYRPRGKVAVNGQSCARR